jgi:membrane-bound metal-dependent hydrolase YbcI (DUF457 family)
VPSPIGHVLAGAAIAWSFRGRSSTGGSTNWKLPVVCAVCAALPDIDLLYMPTHRTATHSVPVAVLLTIVAVGVTGWVRPVRAWLTEHFGEPSHPLVIGLACGLAWSSHILLDWLGADANPPYGVQAFWPVSDTWFFSGLNVFPGTQRRDPLSMRAMLINLRAAIQEFVLMGSVALAAWWLSRTRRSRVPTSAPGDRRPPSGAGAGKAGTSDRPSPRGGR